jgi:6-phosphogluconate dehydrogenase
MKIAPARFEPLIFKDGDDAILPEQLKVFQRCCCAQGEQIGRIFAHWTIVYFGEFFLKITKEVLKASKLFTQLSSE